MTLAGLGTALLLATALACGSGHRKAEPAQTSASAPAAIASVRCTPSGVDVQTTRVGTFADGVHVEIVNPMDEEMVFNYSIDDDSGGGGEQRVPPGRTTYVVPFAPQTLGVACLTPEEDAEILDFAIDFVAIAVVDTTRRPLSCPGGETQSGEQPMEGEDPADFVAASRAHLRTLGVLTGNERFKVRDGFVVEAYRRGRLVASFQFMELERPAYNVAYEICVG